MAEFRPIDNKINQKVGQNMNRNHIYVCTKRFNKPDEIKKFVMFEEFQNSYEDIKNMEVFEDDVWVISFPKCGTTWLQEMVWLINNGLNFNVAKEQKLANRFPFLE